MSSDGAEPVPSQERVLVRRLFWTTASLLPLVALLPGAPEAYGLPGWLLFASCVVFGLVHGTDCLYRDDDPQRDRNVVRMELVCWCALVVVARGPTPMVWVFPYLAAILAAQRVGRDPSTCALLLAACVGANLARALLWDPLPAAAVAHSLAPSALYWLLGGAARTALEERRLIEQLVAAEERAVARRARLALAQDVHDCTGALLVAAAAQTDLALRARNQTDRADRAARRAQALMIRACVDARMFEQPLPSSWEQSVEWLRELVQALAPGATVSSDVCPESALPSPRTWRALRCITSEAVNNAVRHAHAAQVHVRVSIGPDVLELHVRDDGRGLGGSVPGFGRRTIVNRVRRLDGVAEWASRADAGTELRVILPIGAR